MPRSLLWLLALAGCAVSPPDPAPAPVTLSRATIVAVRTIAPAGDIMALLGTPVRASGTAREFILRTAEGRIMSIVQEDDGGLRLGQSVTVVAGERARLIGG